MSEPAGTLLERLVAAACDCGDDAEARRAGGRALFDHLACLTAGRRSAPAHLGDAAAAAATDRDDLHWSSLTHPGTTIWSVLRRAGLEGPALWRAAYAGYEVTARLGRALGPAHRRHWHATTTAGSVGGAVAAALALGTDPVDAAGHAVSLAGGAIVCVLERTATRLVHRDHAAATALRCAELGDLPSARDGLEHPQGMFAAMGGDPELLVSAPERSALSEVSFRRHATSGFSQALVEAARELAPVADGEADEPVLVEAPAATLALAGIRMPRDAEEAWWSAPHAVAVSLLELDLADPALVRDARVARLRGAVRLQVGTVSRVTVGGRSAQQLTAAALTDDDLVAKWRELNPEAPPPLDLLASPPA